MMVTCMSCAQQTERTEAYSIKGAEGDQSKFRCKPCNRVFSRVQRFSKTNEDLVEGFRALDPENHKAFLLSAQSLFGEE